MSLTLFCGVPFLRPCFRCRGRLKANFQINWNVRAIVIDRVIGLSWAFYGVRNAPKRRPFAAREGCQKEKEREKRRREQNEGHTVEGERHPPVLVGGKVFVAKRTLRGC